MRTAFRAELFKLRSTSTAASLFAVMLVLILFAVLLHGLSLSAKNLETSSKQLTVMFGWGEVFGAMFAGILGSMAITGEIRFGSIRPTLLVTPNRRRVVTAKVGASMLIGAAYGLAAGAVAAGVGASALSARGIDIRPDASDFALLIMGSGAAAALWAAIGVGLGAVVRNQVTVLIGICVWILFVENVLLGDIGDVAEIGRLLPGNAGKAMSGQDSIELLAPGFGFALLTIYAVITVIAGLLTFDRRDVD